MTSSCFTILDRAARFLLTGLLCLASLQADAQQANSSLAQLVQMRDSASLDHDGQQPFHLKVSFQIFDMKGDSAEPGTYELWYAGPHRMKSETTIAGQSVLGKPFSRSTYIASQVPGYFLRPMSNFNPDRATVQPAVKRTFGNASFICYLETDRSLPSTFCSDSAAHVLRLIATDSTQTLFTRMGKFRDVYVPLDLVTKFGPVRGLLAHVETLDGITVEQVEQAIGPKHAPPSDSTAERPYTGVIAGRKIGGNQPDYPLAAKVSRISGVVLLGAIISKQGTIQDLVVIASPDRSLSEAAIDAIRTWRYTPYLLNGEPTSVETMITINFNPR